MPARVLDLRGADRDRTSLHTEYRGGGRWFVERRGMPVLVDG
ncbi:hypothetical protein [Rhodococcus koreensis]|nr:hypothetical protein [Rhodococcus koreensis]